MREEFMMARLKLQVGRVFVILLLGVSLSWLMGLACAPAPCPSCDGLCTDLTYDRGGGFTGLSETVTIQPDRAFHVTGGFSDYRAGTISVEQLQELKELLADWCSIREPGEAEPCTEALQYQIEYQGRALSWHSCTPNVSEQLRRIADLVEEVVRSQDQPAWLQVMKFSSQRTGETLIWQDQR